MAVKAQKSSLFRYFHTGEGFFFCIKDSVLIDPACGSGNFLTETYISLRKLENEILLEIHKGQMMFGDGDLNPIQVSIGQFYGIEINDFAVTVAKTALWIAESQMMKETEEIVQMSLDFLPLKSYANIVEGNALRVDWESVVPKAELNFIMGNPPFVGARLMSAEQKDDVSFILNGAKGIGNIDYVSCWYKKAADMMKETEVRTVRYSVNVVYNNFPWCNPTDEQKAKIEQTAQAILDARAFYPDCSLADLYDELAMPAELRKAHHENDFAVMAAYGFDKKITESECVAELMRRYRELTEEKYDVR